MQHRDQGKPKPTVSQKSTMLLFDNYFITTNTRQDPNLTLRFGIFPAFEAVVIGIVTAAAVGTEIVLGADEYSGMVDNAFDFSI